MKHIIALFITALVAVAVMSAQMKEANGAKNPGAQVLKTTIAVPTIVCGSCVTTVTNALKKVDGVKSAKVDLKKKTATVTYASMKVTLDKLEKAIAEAGYDANSVKRNPEAYEKLDDCCKAGAKK